MPKLITTSRVIGDDGELLAETVAESLYGELPPEPPPEPPPSELWTPPAPPTDSPVARKTLSKTWKQVMSEIGGGGTVIVEPGVHTCTVDDAYVFTKNWDHLQVIGELDAQGNRPLINIVPTPDGRGLNNFLEWSGPNGNLWMTDIRVHGAGSNALGCGSSYRYSNKQVVVLDNVEFAYSGHHCLMFAYEFSGALTGEDRKAPVNDELWIRNSDMHHSGSTHVHYCDRIAKEVVINSRFYSPRGVSGHAFKSVARDLTVVDCEISNVELDGSIDYETSHHSFRPSNPPNMYLGAVPVSLVAGQRGYFARNLVTHRTHASYNTGAYMVAMQGRHSIHGLEVPDPLDLTGPFYDPDFWATAEDWSILFEDNGYILLGDSADMPVQKIYQHQGTYPVYYGFPINPVEGVPTFWRERGKPICRGDHIRGFTLRGRDLYVSSPYFHDRNSTDDPVGRFVIETEPVEF